MAKQDDRRARFTREALKDALLGLLGEKGFNDITVAELCRRADVTRATFYRHFDGIMDVVDLLVDDAFDVANNVRGESAGLALLERLEAVAALRSPDELRDHESLLPTCQRLANDEKHLPLLTDVALAEHVIHRIYLIEHDSAVPLYMLAGGLRREEAELLFQRDLYGAFYMNRAMHWRKDDLWYRTQLHISRGILGSLETLRNR